MRSSKTNRINVSNLVYALLLSDTSTGVAYGAVKSLAPLMKVGVTPAVAKGVNYGDGRQTENISKLTGIALAVETNKIPIETMAEIMGHQYIDGVVLEKDGDEPPLLAVGYKVDNTQKKNEYVWLLKGRAQPANQELKQMGDNIDFSNDSININFWPREYDQQIRFYGDTANADFTENQAEAWFLQPPVTYPKKITVTPTSATFDKNVLGTNYKDISATVTGGTITDISIGNVLVDDTNYTVVADVVTIKKEYLATALLGDSVFTLISANGNAYLTITVIDSEA